jgi:hypothetical protein
MDNGLTLNNIIRADQPQSVTRTIALLLVLSIIGWEWWAILHQTAVPNLAELLLFIVTGMGWKQYNERKGATDAGIIADAANSVGQQTTGS